MGKKNRKTKKKFSFKLFIAFIIFELVFTGATGPFMLYYGPFENAKNTVVGAAMTTMTHQWIATTFLSKERINEIQSRNKIETIIQEDDDEVNIKPKHDSSIERYEISGNKFKGTMIIIHDPTRVKVGYTSKLYKTGETTSAMAKRYNAIAAVNGGAFNDESPSGKKWAGNGGQPVGIIISNGKTIHNDYKDEDKKHEIIGITKDGILLVGYHTIREMKQKNVVDAVSFDKTMIVSGKKTIKSGDGGGGIAPRTAIGQRRDGSIMLLVIDGRQPGSLGATYREVQDLMYENGAFNAANLDGGSSSTLYYEGSVINNPCDALGERSIPTIFYVES
ncbi:phosphodiester glycosidase family protein [Clostridium sp. MB40-C1]|uniref:phosphodiester glycosidase family protein n=1 Tax=Clostridium sp. MB40-C1 TaxID=3070996 RepID=UPI0027E01EC0|nr:phosphodiester glycosidase family protein [Clostridium sp. MB40-C1]WMJ79468.1 phosphodiester glycosidase family protein [Clostridium sp. MB40-C1]